jgi:hypothetical protein
MGDFKDSTMLKQTILLFFLLIGLLAKSQNLKSMQNTLTIGFVYGDEVMAFEELHFNKVGNKVIGSISHPNTDKVLPSDVELDLSQTKTIDSFLCLVEKYKKEPCDEKDVSTFAQYYTVIQDKDTIKIYRFCDWKNLTFFNIKQLIFKDYLKELEIKKAAKTEEYFKIFKGKWKESSAVDKLSLASVCDLIKVANDFEISDCIEFVSPTKLVLRRKNKNVFYNYHLEFSGQNTYIELDAYENGTEFIYGHSFLIVESNNRTMKLSRGFP